MMNEYAVITGASSGIGLEFAREFAKRGVGTLLVARSRDRLEQISTELKSNFGADSSYIALDLTEPIQRNQLMNRIADTKLNVSYLVNSAGFGSNGFFPELDLDNELRMTELNCAALQELTYRFVRIFLQKKKGIVVNIASTAAFQPVPYMAVYSATKAFVLSFSLALNRELSGTGVRTFALCPGPVDTNFILNAGIKKPKTFLKVHAPEHVVRKAFRAIDSNKTFAIVGLLNRILYYSGVVIPLSVKTAVTGKMFKPPARQK